MLVKGATCDATKWFTYAMFIVFNYLAAKEYFSVKETGILKIDRYRGFFRGLYFLEQF